MRVLLAEDHEVQRGVLTVIFTALGCDVTGVRDWPEALVGGADFDVICITRDMASPGEREAVARLRRTAFLVTCTANPAAAPEDFHMAVPKPFRCADIVRVMDAARAWHGRRGHSHTTASDAQGWPPRDRLNAAL